MSQPLLIRKFKWLKKAKIELIDIESINVDSQKGYILVDLEYPEKMHDSHKAYPLTPESLVAQREWISNYRLELLGDRPAPKVKKLTPNLHNKYKHVLHYHNLQLYLSLGMKLKRIHQILKFNQEPWMRSYIDLNTNLRKNAKSDFEKDFYKLMKNSVFGKIYRESIVRESQDV